MILQILFVAPPYPCDKAHQHLEGPLRIYTVDVTRCAFDYFSMPHKTFESLFLFLEKNCPCGDITTTTGSSAHPSHTAISVLEIWVGCAFGSVVLLDEFYGVSLIVLFSEKRCMQDATNRWGELRNQLLTSEIACSHQSVRPLLA